MIIKLILSERQNVEVTEYKIKFVLEALDSLYIRKLFYVVCYT